MTIAQLVEHAPPTRDPGGYVHHLESYTLTGEDGSRVRLCREGDEYLGLIDGVDGDQLRTYLIAPGGRFDPHDWTDHLVGWDHQCGPFRGTCNCKPTCGPIEKPLSPHHRRVLNDLRSHADQTGWEEWWAGEPEGGEAA